jgi:hypothetical protein
MHLLCYSLSMNNVVTFKKVTTGNFDVLVNGVPCEHTIINGSLGVSGRNTENMYGITGTAKGTRWIGTLQACKKLMIHKFTKEAK